MGDSTTDEPRPEPSPDVRREMADGLTGGKMDPHLRVVLDGWVRNEPHLVSRVQMLQVTVTTREYGTVDRGTEARGLTLGKRRSGSCHRVGFGGPGPRHRPCSIKLGAAHGEGNNRLEAPMDAIYLDHAATTPVRDEVVAAMAPYMSEVFANPSSLHGPGRRARGVLEEARETIANALGARPAEIRFVRGGTESDNLAVLGTCRAIRARNGTPPRLFVSAVEHSAVLEAAEHAAATGDARLTVLAVSPRGDVGLEPLRAASPDESVDPAAGGEPAAVVSVMWVNNETGLVLPVEDVVEAARRSSARVHTDASQALGKVPVDVSRTHVDLLTATGHKLGGPRGSGILYVRDGVELSPLLHGGGQERALRPGTEDVAGAVGLAEAIRLAVAEQAEHATRMEAVRRRLEDGLRAHIDGVRINGGDGPRSCHVSSVGIPGIADGETLLMALDLEGLAVSGGSACHSGAGKGSHVIEALYGADDRLATIRYSFAPLTSDEDVDGALAITAEVVGRLRASTVDAA